MTVYSFDKPFYYCSIGESPQAYGDGLSGSIDLDPPGRSLNR
ncbi:hypothetical protein V0288_17585 [Pannus brasiliensis CCIBt3594]|uniref:Uncharacterized protein n=1 Tax=Pannus brasiliensis CCIBt3594 TaxID=1427578 RepID=A0AAW9QPE1_9CHRO